MPAPARNATLDGISIVTGGMNSGVAPRLILPNQIAFACNLTMRGGMPRTRPAFRKIPLQYDPLNETETNAKTKLFQRASFYQTFGNAESCLIASIGGRIFRYLVGSNNMVQDISIQTSPGVWDLNSPVEPLAWMWQSEDFLIINDNQSLPLFWDGSALRRSLGPGGQELPVGNAGAYVQGRNWMGLPNRQSFMASDLVYTHGFTGPYGGREAVLETSENTFLSGGGAFSIPVTSGQLTALTSIAVPDTSLGQGSLVVLTPNSVFSVQVPFDRTQWPLVQYPLMTVGLPNYGAMSATSTITINGDIWHRSYDGIRSYKVARRDFDSNYVNTPLSVEMDRVLRRDSVRWLEYGSGVNFDNRLLMTASPYQVIDHGIPHRGLIALDFNNVSNLTTRSNPDYDGLWTGLRILQVLKGTFHSVERCFAFCLDPEDAICLYEILPDGRALFDSSGDADPVMIESWFESRALHQSKFLTELNVADVFLDSVGGNENVEFDFKYRSDQHPAWQDWYSFVVCAPSLNCDLDPCEVPENVRQQYRAFKRLPMPSDECNPITGRAFRTGYEYQIRMQWTGNACLNKLMSWAIPKEEAIPTLCVDETCQTLGACDLSLFTYNIESGG